MDLIDMDDYVCLWTDYNTLLTFVTRVVHGSSFGSIEALIAEAKEVLEEVDEGDE